ncbi:MAG: tetratricopeptide repeat protein [Planctomycetes bacterium]|nr:tetratricopeptide repeat protein [Planctomycetota bacterium]
MTSAEQAYLFRHALLRDAAYDLQTPSDRAALHELAFHLIEQAFGGRAPEPPPLDALDPPPCAPHGTDIVSAELAYHARLAADGEREGAGVPPALCRLYLHRAAEYLERAFQAQASAQAWQALSELVAGAARGECHRRAGAVLLQAGQPVAAQSAFTQSLAIAREVGNRRSEGMALGNLASVYRDTGRVEQAERTHEQALAVHREVGNRSFEGMALGNLANVYRETGRVEQAERTYERALAIHREVGNRRDEGIALGNLAGVYLETGRMEQAEWTCEQALTIHREVGNRRFEGITLCDYALCLLVQGRHQQARERWREGAAILRELADTGELERKREAMQQACARASVPPFDDPEERQVAGSAQS